VDALSNRESRMADGESRIINHAPRTTHHAVDISRWLSYMNDARFSIGVALVLLVVAFLPTAFGYLSCPPDKWFTGIVYNVHDTGQYLSWMREAGQRLFIENRLTAEPTAAVFLNLHWWIPGRLAYILGLSMMQVYQLFRVVAILLYVGVAYWFCGLLFRDTELDRESLPQGEKRETGGTLPTLSGLLGKLPGRESLPQGEKRETGGTPPMPPGLLDKRRFAFLLTTLTSGLGWIWVVHKYATGVGELLYPHDVYTTPGNTFWVMVASPHLTFALGLTLLVLGLALEGYRRQRFALSLVAAFLALFLGMGHIYDLVTVWAVLGVFGVLVTLRDGFRWRTFWSLFVVVLVSAPAALYWGFVSSPLHPAWQKALAQYDNLGAFTPGPLHLVILLGLTFIVALVHWLTTLSPPVSESPKQGRVYSRRNRAFMGLGRLLQRSDRDLFLRGWFLANLIIIYLPLHFAVMLLTGFQFVMAVLATDWLFDRFLPWLQKRVGRLEGWKVGRLGSWKVGRLGGWEIGRLVPVLFLLLVLPTNLYLLAWRFIDLNRHSYPFYLHRDEVAAMRWLDEHADPNDVVLSAFVTGHFIPGLAGNKVFLGNAVMTLDFVRKREMVKAFFDSATPDSERQALIREYGIRYVFYGPAEQALGDYDPGSSPFFREVFSSPRVKVYRVEG